VTTEILDVLIIGAGVSGIGMACTLKTRCPDKSYLILESRERLGGTWDLFRFPGVRSDSDMHTYAYGFRPWSAFKLLGDGAEIRTYLAETARESGIERHIRYNVRIRRADWSSITQLWTLQAENGADQQPMQFRCRYLVMGTGYYDYQTGHTPAIPGLDSFAGRVIHPQHWPEDFDHAGKRVVVVGSGATAVTLVPAMAQTASHVTMLQRSPTYLLSMPRKDVVSRLLSTVLPARWVFAAARRLNTFAPAFIYRASRRWPAALRRLLLAGVRAQLKGAADMRHFQPRDQPWDQRLCAVADGDLFERIRAGKAEVVTDDIEQVEANGVRLHSGRRLDADVLVTATGLNLQAFGGIALYVDGLRYQPGEHLLYRAVLPEGLPNLAWIIGYINHSWTLKADMATAYVCRLLQHMDAHGQTVAVAHDQEGCVTEGSIMSALNAGYVHRSSNAIPRQGRKAPWRVTHDLRDDRRLLLEEPIDDGILQFKCEAAVGRSARLESCGAEALAPTPLHTGQSTGGPYIPQS